jgi:hypothetical protein
MDSLFGERDFRKPKCSEGLYVKEKRKEEQKNKRGRKLAGEVRHVIAVGERVSLPTVARNSGLEQKPWNNTECLKKSFTMVFQMLLCGECYENVYTYRLTN